MDYLFLKGMTKMPKIPDKSNSPILDQLSENPH